MSKIDDKVTDSRQVTYPDDFPVDEYWRNYKIPLKTSWNTFKESYGTGVFLVKLEEFYGLIKELHYLGTA